MRNFFGGTLVLLSLGVGFYFVVWPELRTSAPDEEAAMGAGGAAGSAPRSTPVFVEEAQRQLLGDLIEAIGTTRANESVTLTAKVAETVSRVHFEDGDLVREGDLLVELLNTEEEAVLREALAQRDEAAKQLERARRLVSQDSMAQTTLDQRRAELDASAARVAAIEARLADRLILAPFDGVLGFRNISVGTFVRPGEIITTLDDISEIKLDFTVPETVLSALQPGQTIEARAAAFPGKLFTGTVRSLDSRVNPATRALTIRAVLPNPEGLLRPGMLMTVELQANERQAILIPEEALIPLGDRQFVYTVNGDDQAVRVEVQTGSRRPGQVEILQGLEAGSRVITEGGIRLSPGGSVNIVQKQES